MRLTGPGNTPSWTPPSESVIGRSPMCTRQLDAADVSKEHASLRWTGARWELRDLNSRNGTFAGGVKLGPGDVAEVVVGMTVRFGASAVFEVADDAPPPPMALAVEAGDWCIASGQLLALPDESNPEATIHRDAQGRWLHERDGAVTAVEHGDAVSAGGQTWRLYLPSTDEQTAESLDAQLSLATTRLTFLVSRDEEHVQVLAESSGRQVDLKARAHHYVLLTLARRRDDDERAGVPAAEQGWVYHDALARMLSTARTHINVAVYRLRKQLQDAGFIDAAQCIERRLSTGQLRIGLSQFEIVPTTSP
ncbi:MAG: FHA domain-containing protein [Myxococcota bacterium]